MPNVELLRATLEYVESHPDEWHQRHWRCDTAMCFAGHAAVLAGGVWVDSYPYEDEYMVAEDADDDSFLQGPDGNIHVEYRAQRVLGLDAEQADRLFSSFNDLDQIRAIVAELCAPEADDET
jgi:hypothetical protein